MNERKLVKYKNSAFVVEKVAKLWRCGLIEGVIQCPFYSVINEGLTIHKSVKNVNTSKNMERHNCFLLKNLIYGVDTSEKLWELCPGKKI